MEMFLPRTCSLSSPQCLPVASSTTVPRMDTCLCTVAAVGLNGHFDVLLSSRHNVVIILYVSVQPLTCILIHAFVSFQPLTYVDASICTVAAVYNMDACMFTSAAVVVHGCMHMYLGTCRLRNKRHDATASMSVLQCLIIECKI